jgi:hypothetical protein
MFIVADQLPDCKRFFRSSSLSQSARLLAIRLVATFVFHAGRMTCMQAAGAIRCEPRHRAQVTRFLARPLARSADFNAVLRQSLLAMESRAGRWIYIIDATLCGQAGKRTENTYSTGNRQRRPCEKPRYGKYKHTARSCHSFTMGLLISPSGMRIPFCKPYHTQDYCRQRGLAHRTTAEAAADLIRELPLPEGAEAVVLGDTAYDSQVLRDACKDRHYDWIVPCNPERVLAGPHGKRPKVRSLLKDWSTWSRRTIRLASGQGPYAVYRRLSRHRIGPKAKPRTYYVHQEQRTVHSVGEVQLVFSTTKQSLAQATPDNVKILMTNALQLSAREVVELYSLRWQIELFFKEIKSVLGFHQYRFRRFAAVERWTEVALTAFLYLEWQRARRLQCRALREEEKRWWREQRTYGLCLAIRQASHQAELEYLAAHLTTPRSIAKLKREVKNGFAEEYQAKP